MGCGASNEMEKVNKHNGQKNREIEQQIRRDKVAAKKEIKLLLLGTGESGKSTIVKQMRIIHLEGFSAVDYEYFSVLIRINIVQSMASLVRATQSLGLIIRSRERNIFAKLLIKLAGDIEMNGNLNHEEFKRLSSSIRDLWEDESIQSVYNRSNEFQLQDGAK